VPLSLQYIEPGKPNQNAYIERLNRTLREDVLDQYLFRRLQDVREAAYWWMLEYNEERPHDSLGDMTPSEFRQQHAKRSSFEVSA
jgi:putative transposase